MNKAKLLIVNYSMSSSSQIFAHQNEIAKRLAIRFDSVLVLTFEKIPPDTLFPSNMKVVAISWKPGQHLLNIFRIYSRLFTEIIPFRPDAVFFHMTDVAAALLSPFFNLAKKRTVLWYAHISNSPWLRFAVRFVDEIATSTEGSFPNITTQRHIIGQSIDTKLFHFYPSRNLKLPLRAIHIGRIDPAKRIGELLDWSKHAIDDGFLKSLTLVGQPTSSHLNYGSELQCRFKNYIDDGKIIFEDPISNYLLPQFLSKYDIFLHLFQGSLDKSILEATAVGIPVVSVNNEYLREFGSWNKEDVSFDAQLKSLLDYETEALRIELSRRQRIVSDRHSIDNWIREISKLLVPNINEDSSR